jgi:hypothetical protein
MRYCSSTGVVLACRLFGGQHIGRTRYRCFLWCGRRGRRLGPVFCGVFSRQNHDGFLVGDGAGLGLHDADYLPASRVALVPIEQAEQLPPRKAFVLLRQQTG